MGQVLRGGTNDHVQECGGHESPRSLATCDVADQVPDASEEDPNPEDRLESDAGEKHE